MSEAILLNQYSQNNGGGGNPWDIPPFNWYGKGVVQEAYQISNANLSNKTAPSGSEQLQTVLDIEGPGALYDVVLRSVGAGILKITIDNSVVLFAGAFLSSQYIEITLQTLSYVLTQNNTIRLDMSYMTRYPNKNYVSSSGYTVHSAYAIPFYKNLKIECNGYATDAKISYIYDLFNE